VTITTVVAHHRQTTISLTFPFLISNFPTFPGFPRGWPPRDTLPVGQSTVKALKPIQQQLSLTYNTRDVTQPAKICLHQIQILRIKSIQIRIRVWICCTIKDR